MSDLEFLLRSLEKNWHVTDIDAAGLRMIITKAIAMKQKVNEEQERILDDAYNDAMSDKAYGSGD